MVVEIQTSRIPRGLSAAERPRLEAVPSRVFATVDRFAIGAPIAAVAFWKTGLTAAIPAGLGLSVVARSDFATHQFSLSGLRLGAAVVALCLVLDTTVSSEWDRLGSTTIATGLVAVGLLAVWLTTKILAFGDVLLVAFALLVPAWLSLRAAGTTAVIALVVAGGIAVVQRRRRTSRSASATVALGPALLAGWLVGVTFG